MTISEFVRVYAVDMAKRPISRHGLNKAQRLMGVTFGPELSNYLTRYGYLGLQGINLYGMDQQYGMQSTLVTHTLQMHKESAVARGFSVLDTRAPGLYTLIDEHDNIFFYDSWRGQLYRAGYKLHDYIVLRLSAAELRMTIHGKRVQLAQDEDGYYLISKEPDGSLGFAADILSHNQNNQSIVRLRRPDARGPVIGITEYKGIMAYVIPDGRRFILAPAAPLFEPFSEYELEGRLDALGSKLEPVFTQIVCFDCGEVFYFNTRSVPSNIKHEVKCPACGALCMRKNI